VHEIHSSELRGYRQCRQLHKWRYVDNWEPIKKPAPLEDGTIWHKALEVLYNPETWNLSISELHKLASTALIAEAEKERNDYLERSGKYQLEEEEALEYGERLSILRSMLVKLCRSLDREKYKPVAVEQEFECSIRGSNGVQLYCNCLNCKARILPTMRLSDGVQLAALPVTFNCRIDVVFEDQEGFIFATDHKSTATLLRKDSIIPELEDQLPNYLWCLRENGLPVTGAILNQFRKAYPKPPKRLERPQQGRLYSINRLQLTDYHTARQVFRNHDSRAFKHGLYNEYLDWLKENGPEFDRQFPIFKTPEYLDTIGRNIAIQASELINQGPAIYPNPNKTNCERCSFQQPCLTAQGGGDPTGELEASFVKSEPYYIQRRKQV
jgi:hypothetical protein